MAPTDNSVLHKLKTSCVSRVPQVNVSAQPLTTNTNLSYIYIYQISFDQHPTQKCSRVLHFRSFKTGMWHLCHEIHSLQLVYNPPLNIEAGTSTDVSRQTHHSVPTITASHWSQWNPAGHVCIHNMCSPRCATDWLWPCRRDQWFGIMKNGRHLERAREVGERVATSWDLSSSYSCYSLIFLPPGTDLLADPWACVDVRLSELGRWLDYTDNCLNQ